MRYDRPQPSVHGWSDIMGGYVTVEKILFGIAVGIAATVTMDVLSGISRRMGLTAGAKGQWVGRWYLGIARGQFFHSNIADAPEQAGEKRAAQVGHFIIGIVLAVFYVVVTDWLGVSPGSLLVALGYGLATCVFPWFLVYPSLGFGVFGLEGPSEMKPVMSSIVYHLFYGLGLWWSAALLPFD